MTEIISILFGIIKFWDAIVPIVSHLISLKKQSDIDEFNNLVLKGIKDAKESKDPRAFFNALGKL